MIRASKRGSLNPGRTAGLLVAFVLLLGAVLYSSGYLPFRLRDDGLYGGNQPTACSGPEGTASIARPRLEFPAPARMRSGYHHVARVIDGDTLEISRDGKFERIRLIGVDCPEVPGNTVNPDSHGWRATMFVHDLIQPDPQVRLRFDAEREDKYGRTLAYVYLPDGSMLNEELMRHGWAKVMRIAPNTKHAKDFAKLESEARSEAKGIWRAH